LNADSFVRVREGDTVIHDFYPADQGTPHNSAVPGAIASTVLMPGDPLRARFVAETYLSGVVEFSHVRGMLGFTGTYQGRRISLMGSGMGGPSMGIYSYELFSHYGVERIIRIGTCGGLTADVEVGDLLFAQSASTDSNYADQYDLPGVFAPCADFGLLETAVGAARRKGFRHWVGSVFSSDLFSLYSARGDEGWKRWARMGCAGTDMECYALYCNAAYLGKKALTILTCSDSNVTRKEMTPQERQTALIPMFEVALEFALDARPVSESRSAL
jgi:purine-nucleoside phosphorylase